jgi:hypothetical protein
MSDPGTCVACGQMMERGVACTVAYIDGRQRVPYGLERDDWALLPAHGATTAGSVQGNFTTGGATSPAALTAAHRSMKDLVTRGEG